MSSPKRLEADKCLEIKLKSRLAPKYCAFLNFSPLEAYGVFAEINKAIDYKGFSWGWFRAPARTLAR
jgi:hypothetical protein